MQSNQYKTEVRNLPQGDCWSLGVIIYYMIEGHLPFGDQDIYLHVTNYDYAPLSEKNKTWENFFKNVFCEMGKRWNIYEIEKHIRSLKDPVILSKSQLHTKKGTPSSNFSTQMSNSQPFNHEVNVFLKKFPEAKVCLNIYIYIYIGDHAYGKEV